MLEPTFVAYIAALRVVAIDRQPEVEIEGGRAEEDCYDDLPGEVDQHPRHHGQPGDDEDVDTQPEDYQLQTGSAK